MNLKNIRIFLALICALLCANPAAGQSGEKYGAVVLRVYYSDLYLAFAQYEIDDIPFQQPQVRVQKNDSLLTLAKRHQIDKLDSLHLAAAIYEKNQSMFAEDGSARLTVGAKITMPSVGDILYAQERFEKLAVVGENLVFVGDENQMRDGSRLPFDQPVVALGPFAKEAPRPVEVIAEASIRLDSKTPDNFYLAEHIGSSDVPAQLLFESAQAIDTQEAKTLSVAKVDIAGNMDTADPVAEPEVVLMEQTAAAVTQTLATSKTVSDAGADDTGTVAATDEATVLVEEIPTTEEQPASDEIDQSVAEQSAPPKVVQSINAGVIVAQHAAAVGVEQPAITMGNSFASRDKVARRDYFGPAVVSGGRSRSDYSADPLSSLVEWQYADDATVGTVLNTLAEYIGYELVSTDNMVLESYTRQLPAMQRNINGITAESGILLLAGRGLETVFDHVARTVKHVPKTKTPSALIAKRVAPSKVLERYVSTSGLSSMLQQFPQDILSAAKRHANRCDSSPLTHQPDMSRLYKVLIAKFQQKTTEPVARSLIDWYESPTGRKVEALLKRAIDDAQVRQFSVDNRRASLIKQIYDNTVTGSGIASIAVELDYAGWLLSGCKQKAEISGDTGNVNQEVLLGQGIRKKREKLESILRDDMLRTLAYQLSSLSQRELTEYANVVTRHSGVYFGLEQSVREAIAVETSAVTTF